MQVSSINSMNSISKTNQSKPAFTGIASVGRLMRNERQILKELAPKLAEMYPDHDLHISAQELNGPMREFIVVAHKSLKGISGKIIGWFSNIETASSSGPGAKYHDVRKMEQIQAAVMDHSARAVRYLEERNEAIATGNRLTREIEAQEKSLSPRALNKAIKDARRAKKAPAGLDGGRFAGRHTSPGTLDMSGRVDLGA